MMEKPKSLYNSLTYLVTYYGYYDIAENLLNIPEIFTNFSDSTRDLTDPDILKEVVREQFIEHINENLGGIAPDHVMEKELTFYVIPFVDADCMIEFENLISQFDHHVHGNADITIDDYHTLITTLPKQKEITFKLAEQYV